MIKFRGRSDGLPAEAEIIHSYLMKGNSLTVRECQQVLGIYTMSQRIQDIKNAYVKQEGASKVMKINESIEDKIYKYKHARYFIQGAGCPFEKEKEGVCFV